MLVWALHVPLSAAPGHDGIVIGGAAVATLAIAATCSAGFPLSWTVAAIAVPAVVLVVIGTRHHPDAADPHR